MNPCYIITKISHSLLSNKEYFKKNQKYYLYLQIKINIKLQKILFNKKA